MTNKVIFQIMITALSIAIVILATCKIRKYIKSRKQKIIKNSDLIKNPICPWCKTGEESLALDRTSPVCPYIGCLKNGECSYFKPLDTKK